MESLGSLGAAPEDKGMGENAGPGGGAVRRLDGPLTLMQAEELQSFLLESLSQAEQIVLDFSGVKELDLSCLRMLCALHRTSAQTNKRLVVAGEEEIYKKINNKTRFFRDDGCVEDSSEPCFWVKKPA